MRKSQETNLVSLLSDYLLQREYIVMILILHVEVVIYIYVCVYPFETFYTRWLEARRIHGILIIDLEREILIYKYMCV